MGNILLPAVPCIGEGDNPQSVIITDGVMFPFLLNLSYVCVSVYVCVCREVWEQVCRFCLCPTAV